LDGADLRIPKVRRHPSECVCLETPIGIDYSEYYVGRVDVVSGRRIAYQCERVVQRCALSRARAEGAA
jgi:hypothetical protein